MSSKVKTFKHAIVLATYLLIVWGFYRLIFKLPDEIEETIIKPILWLFPVAYLLIKDKENLESIGITAKNLFPSIYLSIGLGALFAVEALVANYLKNKGLNFGANIGATTLMPTLGLSFATAVSEEIAFRGYIFNRLFASLKDEYIANLITGIFWVLIHVPTYLFVWKLGFGDFMTYLFLTALFGIGSAFIFVRTKNIASSILLHVLWEWPIILFR